MAMGSIKWLAGGKYKIFFPFLLVGCLNASGSPKTYASYFGGAEGPTTGRDGSRLCITCNTATEIPLPPFCHFCLFPSMIPKYPQTAPSPTLPALMVCPGSCGMYTEQLAISTSSSVVCNGGAKSAPLQDGLRELLASSTAVCGP